MYCRNCGKEILEDSKYCSACGYSTSSDSIKNKKIKLGELIEPFSKPTIIFIIAWWTVAALVCTILLWIENEDFVPALIVVPIYIAIPLLVYTIYYFRNKRSGNTSITPSSIPNQITHSIHEDSSIIPLVDFAKDNGKMQVCKAANKDGHIQSKCIFTKIIEVNFSSNIGELSAKEISENKHGLVIKKENSGTYTLTAMEGYSLQTSKDSELPPPIDKISE